MSLGRGWSIPIMTLAEFIPFEAVSYAPAVERPNIHRRCSRWGLESCRGRSVGLRLYPRTAATPVLILDREYPRRTRGFFAVFTGGKTATVTGTVQVNAKEPLTARFDQAKPATGIIVGRHNHPCCMPQASEQAESV